MLLKQSLGFTKSQVISAIERQSIIQSLAVNNWYHGNRSGNDSKS